MRFRTANLTDVDGIDSNKGTTTLRGGGVFELEEMKEFGVVLRNRARAVTSRRQRLW